MPSGVKKKSARRKKKDKQRKANNRRILAGHHHNPPRKKVQYEPPPVQHDEDSSSSSSEESSSSSSSSSLHRPLPKQVIPHSSFSRKNSVTWSDLSGPESKRSLGTGSTPMSNHTKGSSQGPQTSGYPRAKEILKRPSYGLGKRPSVVIESGESQLGVNIDDLENHNDGNSSNSDESSDSSGSEYTSGSNSSEEEEMKFTYPMWHRHHIMVETALSSHQNEKVEIMKTGMKRLQKVHDKTETHPIIAKLLIAKLTYEGFEFDKRFAMDLYLKLEDKAAKEFIMDMVKKQKTLKTKQELDQKKKLEMERTQKTQQKQQSNQVSEEEDSSSSEEESGSEDDSSSSSSSSDSSDGEEKKMEEPIPKKATLKPPSEPIPAQTIPPYNNPDGVPSYITSGDDTTYSSVGASVGGSNPFKHMPTSTQQHTLPKANLGGIFDNVGLDSMQWKTSKQTLSTQKSQPNSELMKVDMDVSVSSESPRDVMRRIETQWTKNYRPSRRRSVDVVSKESARERMRRLEQKYHKNSSM